MSSEPEKSVDHPNKLIKESLASERDVSTTKKENGVIEHAKPKRRRRGKKHKHRKESTATCESENHEECDGELASEHDIHDPPTWDSDEDLSCDVNAFNDVIIRPINVPKAPENSTQFIMDDHNECRLYMSFETPNPYLSDRLKLDTNEGDVIEPEGEDAAYRDIDYEYESPQDFDNSAYYDKEFEQSYKNNRFDELMRLPRGELIGMLQTLETRSKELNDELVKENPSPMLEKLQHELLELQEKHNFLQECNSKLTGLVHNETECSVDGSPDESHEELMSHSYLSLDSPRSADDSREVLALDDQNEDMSQDDITFESPESPDEWQEELLSHGSEVCREYHDVCREDTFDDTCVSSDVQNVNHVYSESVTELVDPRLKLKQDSECQASRKEAPSVERFPISSKDDLCEIDSTLPDVYDNIRESTNSDNEMLNIGIQEKCSSEVLREDELPTSEASVI